jgi:hypothetical protein
MQMNRMQFDLDQYRPTQTRVHLRNRIAVTAQGDRKLYQSHLRRQIMYKPKAGLAVSLILGVSLLVMSTTQAQLPSPLPDGTRLTIGAGSFFEIPGIAMIPLTEGADGLVLGAVVSALPGSFHPGLLDGNPDEQGGVVESYELLGNTGTFWTELPVVDLGGGLIDMSGWSAAWGIEPIISFDDPNGFFTVTGEAYILDYDALATSGPFPGIPFILHLEGEVQLANQAPDCSQAVASVDLLWPPNHKFVSVNLLGVTDPDGDPVTITIDSIFQDEPVDSFGDGRFSPDGAGVGAATAELRAERSGTKKVPGNGRVYHIGFTAKDGNGGACSGEVPVGVPHNRNVDPIDGGALYDSTMP